MSDAWPGSARRGASRSLVRSLRDLFVAPAGVARVEPAVAAAPALAILCSAPDARAVAVVAASVLSRRGGASCALASVWTPDGDARWADARPPAAGAARRLSASLSARGLTAGACGRAALVALPADPLEAVPAARRAFAASGDAPTVLVAGGPRDAAFDALLGDHDLVLVLARDGESDAVASLAVAGLGPRALARPFALGPAARALVLGGAFVPASARRALAEPVAALG